LVRALASHHCGWIEILISTTCVDRVCCWFSLLLWEVFISVHWFFSSPKKPTVSNSNSTGNGRQGTTLRCKESHFYSLPFGKADANITSPTIFSTSPKNVLMSRLISQFFCNLNSSKNFTCSSGKLITEFTSSIAKSTSPRLSDSTFFACCTLWMCYH